MNLWGAILRLTGWKVSITAPQHDKCVICVAPHTSNWDFILGLAAYRSLGRKANFLMKEFWFFFPLKYLLKALGGIPVPSKNKGGNLTNSIISLINESGYVNLAVTPEGTRSRQPKWRTGFLYIVYATHVPLQLGVIDYSSKEIIIRDEFVPSGDPGTDMAAVKEYYRRHETAAKYPSKFTV